MTQRNSIESGQIKDLDQLVQALMDLPPAPYIAGLTKSFDPSDGYEINMRCAGITSANSAKPILGTRGLSSCMGVAVFNPELKTGGLAHLSQDPHNNIHLSGASRKALSSLLAAARGDSDEGK